MKTIRNLFFVVFFCFTSYLEAQVIPQDIKPGDLQNLDQAQMANIKIDDIPDEQLKMYLEKAESAGYSDSEIELALKMRGVPESEVLKLRARIQKIRAGTVGESSSFDKIRTREEVVLGEDDVLKYLTENIETLREEELTEKAKRIFGYKLFNSEILTFEPNLNIATPKDYQVGPGDEIIIDIWGASEQNYQSVISPEGFIKISGIGPIYINGLTVDDASKRIKSRLSKIYYGLQGNNPNTFAQVSLGQVRTIKVHVIGEALRPGTYNVSSLSSVTHALYSSRGPNVNGSMRNIDVIRNGKVIEQIDVYDFLMNGVIKNNIRLESGDIIRINPYLNRVEINGEVKREGIYETIEGETFDDLIRYAGGFTENAYSKVIKVRRNNGDNRVFLDINKSEIKKEKVFNGDLVSIQGIIDRYNNRVQIRGAVFREGEYELKDSLTISGLIKTADGLRGDAFLERGTIYRTNEDYSFSVLSFNVRDVLKGGKDDLLLRREDVVTISSIYDLKEEFYVEIFGEVKSAGVYPYYEKMTIEDLIVRSGGLRESASGSQVEVARRIESSESESNTTAQIFNFPLNKSLTLNENTSDFVLQPFDQVYVRKSPGYQTQITVKVEGEVLYPGHYALKKKDERISDLINRSGGITNEGFIEGATLIRRTEFNPPASDEKMRLENLKNLQNNLEVEKEESQLVEAESEYLQQKRLQDIDKQLRQYKEEEDAEIGREGIRVKRQRMNELLKNDEQVRVSDNLTYETIGIQLEKIINNPGSKYDLILQDGDILSIPRQLETVRLRGEFLYPITVRYDKQLNFKNYVSMAGGFTEDARKKKSYVIYANGSVDRTKKFLFWNNYPKVATGAEIVVPSRPDRKKLSPTEMIAIMSGLTSISLAIMTFANK